MGIYPKIECCGGASFPIRSMLQERVRPVELPEWRHNHESTVDHVEHHGDGQPKLVVCLVNHDSLVDSG